MSQNTQNKWLNLISETGLKAILDPENATIYKFLSEQSKLLKPNSLILDAGAGKKPYKHLFNQHTYQSCDMPGGFYPDKHNFECFLDAIPTPDNHYDAIILTQVLEHTPNPLKVLTEINRTLKPNGKLVLSVPLNAPLHGEPWHFFHFTHYGLSELANESRFQLIMCEKIGGGFWCLGKRLPDTIKRVYKQYDPFQAKKRSRNILQCTLMSLGLLPFYFFGYLLSAYFIRPLFYFLDYLDLNKDFTLGYCAVMKKKS